MPGYITLVRPLPYLKKLKWFKDHIPNLTGSPFAYEYKDQNQNRSKIFTRHGLQMNKRLLTFSLGIFTVIFLVKLMFIDRHNDNEGFHDLLQHLIKLMVLMLEIK